MGITTIIDKLAEFNRDDRGRAIAPAVWLLAAAVLVAVMLSGCAGERTYSPAEIVALQGAAGHLSPPPRRSGSVPIEYYEGQPLVRISFPGVGSFRCILDTGSSDLVIPYRLMLMLQKQGMTDNDIVVLGGSNATLAGGGTIRNVHVKFRQVDLGPWSMSNVNASVIRDGDCLLGMSVLTRFGHPSIDFGNQQLTLAD